MIKLVLGKEFGVSSNTNIHFLKLSKLVSRSHEMDSRFVNWLMSIDSAL